MASFGRTAPAAPSFPTREESPPPPQEDASSDDTIVGLQLIVSGLERQNTRSAAAHLHRILNDYREKRSNPSLPAILITPSDSRTPVDYVYLSIDPAASAVPRPDWLEDIRGILSEVPGLRAMWKISNGPDRARRVYFQCDSEARLESLRQRLDQYMDRHSIATQGSFLNKTLKRVVYDVISYDAVPWLKEHPPTIDRVLYHTEQYRFIQPIYGLELAVSGIREIQGAKHILDSYFRAKYGPTALRTSRLELGGDVYTMVFESWEVTRRVLHDPFSPFANSVLSRFFTVSDPIFLYVMNTAGIPTNPAFLVSAGQSSQSSSVELKTIRAELDEIRQQGAAAMSSFHSSLQGFQSITDRLIQQGNQTAMALSAMSRSSSASSRLNNAMMHLHFLRSERTMLEFQLLHTGQSFPSNHPLYQRDAQLSEDIQRQQQLVDQAMTESQNLDNLLTPLVNSLPSVTLQAIEPGSSSVMLNVSGNEEREVHQLLAQMEEVWYPPPPTTHLIHRYSGCMMGRAFASDKRCTLYSVYSSSMPRWIVFLVLICLFPLFSMASSVSSGVVPFHALSLNANGLGNVMKCNSISQAISSSQPHAWALLETKSTFPVAHRIRASDYLTFESPGLPIAHQRSGRCGVVVGVRRTLASTLVDIPHILNGRVVAVDVILPITSGGGVSHRFIGLYAPWDPGIDDFLLSDFWENIRDLTRQIGSWTIVGDFNATVSAAESSNPTAHTSINSQAFQAFLSTVDGCDAWSLYPERHFSTEYTCHAGSGLSIIDRTLFSRAGSLQGEISLAPHYIGATDHRPIDIHVFLDFQPALSLTPDISPSQPPPSRHCYPRQAERNRLQLFTEKMDTLLQNLPRVNEPVVDDLSYELRYQLLTQTLLTAADASFTLPHPYRPNTGPIRNETIRLLVREGRRLGRLIFALKAGSSRLQSLCAVQPWAQQYLSAYQAHVLTSKFISFHDFLRHIRRSIAKLRYQAEKSELTRRQQNTERARIGTTLRGASAKRLYPDRFHSAGLPVALLDASAPGSFITTPSGIRDATRNYFLGLFSRQQRAPVNKPWLDTPSITEVRARLMQTPFNWPQPLTISDLRALLRKGKTRPAPGPDRWEKWQLRLLSDSALTLVADLLNYHIVRSRFPPCIKSSTLSTLHKRGSRLDLTNYRGVCCSNLLVNLSFAWLNRLLLPYLADHLVIPEGQIATQPGVQARDLLSFFSQLEAWSDRHHTPFYALRRDQTKGFDRLEPEGFYDAVQAYGLPSSIIAFDRSAQSDIPYQVKTAYGLTDTFRVSGVTKQGGPLSPLKSTLTTSLGNRWAFDCARNDPGSLRITTHNHCDPHLPGDSDSLLVSMVEAMDDSELLATTLPSLQEACLRMERFQAAYGWITSWVKSQVYVHRVSDPPPSFQMPSIDSNDLSSPAVTWQSVKVVTDHLEFLRTKVNAPHQQFLILDNLINDFRLPDFRSRLPLPLLRKIFSQLLISRIRPRLAYQPLTLADALLLDLHLARRLHEYLGFPFHFNTRLLTLPLTLFGFDFPSISRMNGAAAVSGLSRDLNHFVPAFRSMARITYHDWMCHFNHCISPLSARGLFQRFSTRRTSLPTAWIIAHQTLRVLHLSIVDTDQSYILRGDVSLRHIANLLPHSPSLHSLVNLAHAGFRQLLDVGSWTMSPSGLSPSFQLSQNLPAHLRFTAAFREWPVLRRWLTTLPWNKLVQGPSSDLLLSPSIRRSSAEAYLHALSSTSSYPAHHLPNTSLAACDASMLPASPLPHQMRSVTFATVTATSSLVGSLSSLGRSTSILHGEVYGLITACLLSADSSTPVSIYSDHLSSVRNISSAISHSPSSLRPSFAFSPARSLYRWLRDLIDTHPFLSLHHVHAHTSSSSPASLANRLVDLYATSVQRHPFPPPPVPVPTFMMDRFTPFHSSFGYIEANLSGFIPSLLAVSLFEDSTFRPSRLLPRFLYDNHPPPDHPYLHATSAFSATLQLYLRSAQLDTADVRHRRLGDTALCCRLGCTAIETAHHLFVQCPAFAEIRGSHLQGLELATSDLSATESPYVREALCAIACRIFFDDADVWPQLRSFYYLGALPSIASLCHLRNVDVTDRFLVRVAHLWHTHSIRLAAHIWAEFKRRLRRQSFSSSFTPTTLQVYLPEHLSYLL